MLKHMNHDNVSYLLSSEAQNNETYYFGSLKKTFIVKIIGLLDCFTPVTSLDEFTDV